MRLKRKNEEPSNKAVQSSGEEFFQLPRAEYLVEEVQKNHVQQISDLVTNPSLQMTNCFTLQVKDNHMKGADIQEGDYVVAEKQATYPEGCVLAVRLGNRQLVRRYFRTGGRIQLQCDPPSRQIIIVEDHTPDFQILGQVVHVIREIN